MQGRGLQQVRVRVAQRRVLLATQSREARAHRARNPRKDAEVTASQTRTILPWERCGFFICFKNLDDDTHREEIRDEADDDKDGIPDLAIILVHFKSIDKQKAGQHP